MFRSLTECFTSANPNDRNRPGFSCQHTPPVSQLRIVPKKDITDKVVAAGYDRMARSSVCICALARDCAPALANNLPLLDRLCARFDKAQVIIVENDSKDESKAVLRAWAGARSHIKLLLDDFGTKRVPDTESTTYNPSYSRFRVENLAFHRNRCLDLAASLPGLEYLIVVDIDLQRIDIDGIAHAFGQTVPWDAQFANGRYSDPWRPQLRDFYFDTYALWELGDSETQTERKIACYQQTLQPLRKGMPLLAVQSAFGGLGIYRWDAIRGHRYGVEQNRSDGRVEVICEHAFIHRRMIDAGHNRLFINPSMLVYYNEPRSAMALRAERLLFVLRQRGIAGTLQKLASKLLSRVPKVSGGETNDLFATTSTGKLVRKAGLSKSAASRGPARRTAS
jgi:hypothetical protein